MEENCNREGKGGKYLKKNIFFHGGEEEQRRKIFGEGKLMVTDQPTNQHGKHTAICLFKN